MFRGDYKSELMWSHYADEHRGVCLEIEMGTIGEKAMDVVYNSDPRVISINKDGVDVEHLFRMITRTKHKYWSYENESRILCERAMPIRLPRDSIRKVYVGIKLDDPICVRSLMSAARIHNPSVEFYQMRYDNARMIYEASREMIKIE